MTGAPIADAMVKLSSSAGELRALVDGDGRFTFRGLPKGGYEIGSDADGYEPENGEVSNPSDPTLITSLTTDGQRLDILIRLWKLAALGGHVYGDTGEPVAGVEVHLLSAGNLEESPPTKTDDRGAFRFYQLLPGSFLVVVPATVKSVSAADADEYSAQLVDGVQPLARGASPSAPSLSASGFRVGDSILDATSVLTRMAPPPTPDGRILTYRTTFFPSSTSLAAAQVIRLRAGDDRSDVDINLQLTTTVAVSGTVTGPAGPVPSLRLTLDSGVDVWGHQPGIATASTMTDANGTFAFLGVAPGQYVINGTQSVGGRRESGDSGSADAAMTFRWIHSPITVGTTSVRSLNLLARDAFHVTGRIQPEMGSPMPSPETLALFHLNLTGGIFESESSVTRAGTFDIRWVIPGTYDIHVISPNGWTVTSMRVDGVPVDGDLALTPSVQNLVIGIADPQRLGQITGTVQADSHGYYPVMVLLLRADSAKLPSFSWGDPRWEPVGADRHFTIEDVPAGDYIVAALGLEDVRMGWRDQVIIATAAAQGARVSIAANTHSALDLKPVTIR